MGKIKKLLLWVSVWLWIWYFTSQELWSVKHSISREIKDSLWTKEILKDEETNQIIKLMSYWISERDFCELLSRHWQSTDSVDIKKLWNFDKAAYYTILEMQSKYGNPKITFGMSHKNYETWKNEADRARFDIFQNRIWIHQLDSMMLDFRDKLDLMKCAENEWLPWWWKGVDSWDRRLYNSWIAELAHARQLQEKWVVKMSVDWVLDYVKSPWNYSKQYSIDWSIENEAHSIYEKEMICEFIENYEKYAKKFKQKNIDLELAKYYGWWFDKYQDLTHAVSILKSKSKSGNAEASYMIWLMYYHQLQWIIYYMPRSNDHKIKDWKIKEGEILEQNVINYLSLSFRQWNQLAGIRYALCMNDMFPGEKNEKVIKVCNDIINKPNFQQISKKDLWNLYHILWNTYALMWKCDEWDKCYVKAHELWRTVPQIY